MKASKMPPHGNRGSTGVDDPVEIVAVKFRRAATSHLLVHTPTATAALHYARRKRYSEARSWLWWDQRML